MLDIFVFFATLSLYSLHRIIGVFKLKPAEQPIRFSYLAQFRPFFNTITGISILVSLFLFLLLPPGIQLLTLIPVFLSAGYAIPFLPGKRRLRDLAYLKVLLVAFSWAWVTVILPSKTNKELNYYLPIFIMFATRFLFIFAIAITFDIRDLQLDQLQQVKTIPTKLGIINAKLLIISCLLIMICCALFNYQLGIYTLPNVIALVFSGIMTGILILFAKPHYHDYYFSGLLDGMILLQAILIFII